MAAGVTDPEPVVEAQWPLRARIVIGVVIGGGAVALGLQIPGIAAWDRVDVAMFVGLAAAVATAELCQMELPYRREKVTFSISDAIWTAALFLVSPSVLATGLVVGVLLGQLVQPWARVKVAFNAGQFLIGISVALLLFGAAGSPPATQPGGWLAAAVAMAGFQVVNTVSMASVISAIEEESFWSVALPQTRILHWVGNLAIGVLGALLWAEAPLALPLLLVPLVITFVAYRGWLRSVEEQQAMRELARDAALISSGGTAGRLTLPHGQEDARALAESLNVMLSRLDAAFARERLFIRETSHELRTPVTICRGYLELLDPEPDATELEETVGIVLDELDRMARIIEDMNTLARMEAPASQRREPIDVAMLLQDVTAKTSLLTDGRLIVAAVPTESTGSRLSADPQRLTQALLNLIKNAVQHTPTDTPIELLAWASPTCWTFEVTDHGNGVPPGQEDAVFQPFCTSGSANPGNGLGLAIVSGIARAHGGRAGLSNRPGAGATFWLEIPK
ncbi:sensor histidine kinase [Aquipuribacter sp. MA13-6]|uniref:sensor histidine kinase n=1 Tax=unclassified Aquipuribacter TaxID=2635084 RepID=UPI003EE93905